MNSASGNWGNGWGGGEGHGALEVLWGKGKWKNNGLKEKIKDEDEEN